MTATPRKYRDVLNRRGVSFRTPAGPVMAHVRKLHEAGMSVTSIADEAAVSTVSVNNYLRGYRIEKGQVVVPEFVQTSVARRIAAVRYIPPAPSLPGRQSTRTGAYVDATGTRRRCEALAAAGFTFTFQGDTVFGFTRGFKTVQHLLRTRAVLSSTAIRVAEGYDKWADQDPLESGVSAWGASRIRNLAVSRLYAPPMCWDPDTIDDPAAFPEWTGACGTADGRRVHAEQGTFPCPPCQEAPEEVERVLVAEKLKQARLRTGLSQVAFARSVGMKVDQYRSWEWGRTKPRDRKYLEPVLGFLDMTYDEITE